MLVTHMYCSLQTLTIHENEWWSYAAEESKTITHTTVRERKSSAMLFTLLLNNTYYLIEKGIERERERACDH